jgi:ribosomal protein S18 acetylase RimI-like enzyme
VVTSTGPVTTLPVTTKQERDAFLRFPWRIYPKESPWVPPLLSNQEELFDPRRHPFHEHAELQLFLAMRGDEAVGRIAAIVNQAHLAVHNDGVGFFGFFESTDDDQVAQSLFDAAATWLGQRGMATMRGPVNPSINDPVGLLIDDFEGKPVVEMPYNPGYYLELFDRCGLRKVRDLYAYFVDPEQHAPTEKHVRLAEKIKERHNIKIRNARIKDAEHEAVILERIYREAWEDNWGAVPLTAAEALYLTKKLKTLADERVVLIAEIDDEPAAFALAVPDWNFVLSHLNGRLFPFNFVKALWYRRKIPGLRLMALGVLREHRRKGIEALLVLEMFRRGIAAGYKYLEVSWVLEDNTEANNILRNLGFPRYRTYGLYERNIGQRDRGGAET